MHQQFIEPTKAAFADIIIPNDKYNTAAIDAVLCGNKSVIF
jgi:uridine kinase